MPQIRKMRWLETENDMKGRDLIVWYLLSWCVGITAYFLSNFYIALWGSVLTVMVISLLNDFCKSWFVPTEARLLADEAISAFSQSYPDFIFRSVALRAIEENRYVYSIRYDGPSQQGRPGMRRYFAVTRETDPLVVELDQSDWWPRGLK